MSFKDYLKDLVDKNKIGKLIKIGIDNIYVWSINDYYIYHDYILYLDIKTHIEELLLNLGINIVPPQDHIRLNYAKQKVYDDDDIVKLCCSDIYYKISKNCDIKSGIFYSYISKEYSFNDHLYYIIIMTIRVIRSRNVDINTFLCKIIHNNKLINIYQICMVDLDIGERVLELTA